ncbi:sporulation protein YjcZ [Paenibacillus sp. Soil522]|nr:sporulation protein YjcZ [Paenibacillus sp. Soil522]
MGYPVAGVGTGCAPVCGGIWTSTGVILVLFILLVIILRSGIF